MRESARFTSASGGLKTQRIKDFFVSLVKLASGEPAAPGGIFITRELLAVPAAADETARPYAWARSKRKRKRKAAPKPPPPRKVHKRTAPTAKARRRRGENVLERKKNDLFAWFDKQGYTWRDYFCMGLLACGLLVVLYYSFSAGGYFVVRRGYGELVVLYLVVLGLLFGLRVGGAVPRLGYLELAFIGGYTVWILLSVTWSYVPARSLDEFIRAVLYLAGYGLFYMYLSRRQWLEWLGHLFIIIVFIIALDSILGKIGIIDHPDPFQTNRLSYPLTYWNTMGLMMIMALPLATRVLADRATNIIVRCFYAPALVLFLSVLFFTFSRAGLLLLMLVFALYLIVAVNRLRAVLQVAIATFWTMVVVGSCYRFLPTMVQLIPNPDEGEGHRLGLLMMVVLLLAAVSQIAVWYLDGKWTVSKEQARRIGYALTGVMLVFFLAGSVVFFASKGGPVSWVRSQLEVISEPETTVQQAEERLLSLQSERYNEYKVSVGVFADNPLKGTGAGTWSVHWLRERPRDIQVKDGHSWLFESMAELGLVGTALLLGFIVVFLIRGIGDLRFLGRSRHREIYGAFFISCVAFLLHTIIDWDWEMAVITLTFFFFAGGLLRYGALSRVAAEDGEAELAHAKGTGSKEGWSVKGVLSWNWLIGALCVVMMLLVIPPLVATNRVQQATQLAQEGGEMATVMQEAQMAHKFNPLDGEPLILEAVANQSVGNPDRAEQLVLEALDLEPYNDKFYRNLTRIYLQEGNVEGAVAAIKKSRQLNPLESRETGALEDEVRKMPGAVL